MKKALLALRTQTYFGAVALLGGIGCLAFQKNSEAVSHQIGLILTIVGFIAFWTGLIVPLLIIGNGHTEE